MVFARNVDSKRISNRKGEIMRNQNEDNFKSSYVHRSASKVNASTEIAGTALKYINPIAALPSKVAQVMNSGYMLFRPEPKLHEKLAHGAQAFLALTYCGLLTALLFKEERCQSYQDTVCKFLLLNDLLFNGVLLLSWIPSEFYRETTGEFERRSNSGSDRATLDLRTSSEDSRPNLHRCNARIFTPGSGSARESSTITVSMSDGHSTLDESETVMTATPVGTPI